MASNAFNRWMVRCMAAAGAKDMTAIEVSLLHHVNHRDRKKKLADICFVLNVEDTHVVTYALKKLVKAGYVRARRPARNCCFRPPRGAGAVHEVPRGARALPHRGTGRERRPNQAIGEAAQLLRNASGLYDTAARGRRSETHHTPLN
jgi:predicted MarR family transcription regulator